MEKTKTVSLRNEMASIVELCDNLAKAFAEQQDDPVSLITIIDMYLEQVDLEGTVKEKIVFLECLLNQLKTHHKIVGEIGWDLPKGLLKLLSKRNVNVNRKLKGQAVVALIMDCFNEVALSGNPKECLLIGCQLLSEISLMEIAVHLGDSDDDDDDDDDNNNNNNNSGAEDNHGDEDNHGGEDDDGDDKKYSDQEENGDSLTPTETIRDNTTDTETQEGTDMISTDVFVDRDPVEFFFGLHSYILFELIQTVLRRISTLYPSKFLGMVVSSIIKYMKTNMDELHDISIVLRRVYTLCKTYVPSDIPKDVKEDGKITPKELENIRGDEMLLQRKLLRSLCTFTIGYAFKTKYMRFDVRYYRELTGTKFVRTAFYKSLPNLFFRYYQLALSFDIDLKCSFAELLDDTNNIYKSLPPDSSVVNEEAKNAIGQVIYQLSYTYQLQKLAKCKDLDLDHTGVLVLSAVHHEVTGKLLLPEINIQDALRLYLRYATPQLFSKGYSNEGAESAVRYWLWVAITNSPYKETKRRLSELPSYLNTVFLQMFLLRNFEKLHKEIRMVNFTLLTRILCFMPEEISFSFITDTLLTCPYFNGKLTVLSILKDLMLKTCDCQQDIVSQLEKMKLDESVPDDVETKNPPPPPPRPYILVNDHRMASIHSIALMVIQACGQETPSTEDLTLLLTLVNFFIALKHKWNASLLKSIHSEIQDALDSKNDDESTEIKLIKLSNETLGKDL